MLRRARSHSPVQQHPGWMLLFLFLCLSLLFSGPTFADSWESLKTEHFYIHYRPVDGRIAQQLYNQSDAIYQTITNDIDYAPKRKIVVYLCPDLECFRQQQPSSRKAPQWAVGLAYPQLNRIVLRSALKPSEGGRIKPLEIFKHEVAHIVLEQALAGRGGAPRWLSEGFSMYHARQWTIQGQRTIEEVTLGKNFIPLSLLTASFPAEEQAARTAYAQSFSVVAFLLHEYDRIFFHRFIDALKRGMDTDSALRASFGMNLPLLELRWQESLKKRYTWFSYLSNSGLFWFVLSLIFLLAYLIKLQRARRIQQRWEAEELEIFGLHEPNPPEDSED